jgi:hypothetical protein
MNSNFIYIIGLAMIPIIILFIDQQKFFLKFRIWKILKNPSYSVGIITEDIPIEVHSRVGSKTIHKYKYSYKFYNLKYEGKHYYSRYFSPITQPQYGSQFIVIYLDQEPEKSVMLFDYPFFEDMDFKEVMNTLKKKPPVIKIFN